MIDLATAAPKRLRHLGSWPTPAPRRARPGTELRILQDGLPRCDDGAAPVLSGDGTEPAMLIGQAPGWREIETGLPFAWDAGKRLCGWLAAAG
ncbi:MAG TPA: uracil-DNA glycosylase family protein, partial [Candidatus Angelobacter sp.]|nr:uracil-DNA glycosylase family protein [Candidatus Angelobacter sp.]